MLNISGRYELDRTRSESLYNHMRALGCDDIAALASEKLIITLDIVQTGTSLTINQSSQLGETTRVLRLDGTETSEGEGRKAIVTLAPATLHIETRFNKGKLSDTRTLEDDVMSQVLELTIKGATTPPIVTRRYMKRQGPPQIEA